jgi:hypothetical protein
LWQRRVVRVIVAGALPHARITSHRPIARSVIGEVFEVSAEKTRTGLVVGGTPATTGLWTLD